MGKAKATLLGYLVAVLVFSLFGGLSAKEKLHGLERERGHPTRQTSRKICYRFVLLVKLLQSKLTSLGILKAKIDMSTLLFFSYRKMAVVSTAIGCLLTRQKSMSGRAKAIYLFAEVASIRGGGPCNKTQKLKASVARGTLCFNVDTRAVLP